MSNGFLHRYFLQNGNLRLHKWIHYFDIYEKHLSRFRGKSPIILEIGVFGGGSLHMWRDYFGEGSAIIGLDIEPACKRFTEKDIDIFIGNQSDPEVLEEILKRYPKIDVVIDDGSHKMVDMTASFEFLYPRISSEGCYMVEDCHTCYWDEFGGGHLSENSFIEKAKRMIDSLNAVHSRGTVPITEFTKTTASINFYDSVVAFEKFPQGERKAIITQGL